AAPAWTAGLLAVLLHLLLFYSIFDIYFTSELVKSRSFVQLRTAESPYPAGADSGADAGAATAKRLVLFVADGIRADKVFGNLDAMPFLKGVLRRSGSWGLSHTRVPTESRPGHVAIIAGFYEDVASVTKAHLGLGSPDIVDMFGRSALHIRAHSYPPGDEEFGKGNTKLLDAWVFDRVEVPAAAVWGIEMRHPASPVL
uniref:GPI ethanolamine phosphate transferase 1 n=1 Tax=Macrostomum lignano TaxID=282301 RepID=A0A1I8IIL1_9PLAT